MPRIDDAYLGEPFGDGVPTYGAQDLLTLDYAHYATPFVISGYSESQTTVVTGNIKRILKVDWPYVKTIINVEG